MPSKSMANALSDSRDHLLLLNLTMTKLLKMLYMNSTTKIWVDCALALNGASVVDAMTRKVHTDHHRKYTLIFKTNSFIDAEMQTRNALTAIGLVILPEIAEAEKDPVVVLTRNAEDLDQMSAEVEEEVQDPIHVKKIIKDVMTIETVDEIVMINTTREKTNLVEAEIDQ